MRLRALPRSRCDRWRADFIAVGLIAVRATEISVEERAKRFSSGLYYCESPYRSNAKKKERGKKCERMTGALRSGIIVPVRYTPYSRICLHLIAYQTVARARKERERGRSEGASRTSRNAGARKRERGTNRRYTGIIIMALIKRALIKSVRRRVCN